MPEALREFSVSQGKHLATATESFVRKPSIVVVGISWPLETFLTRLLFGLANAGFSITIASSERPSSDFMKNPAFQWLKLPAKNRNALVQLFHFMLMTVQSRIFAGRDHQVLSNAFQHMRWREASSQMLRILPFAGKRWDLIYFPWNSAAIHYLPLFRLDIPVVLSCRGSQFTVAPHNPKRQSMREGLSKTFELASMVHCVSDAIRNAAFAYGLDAGKLRVIRPAVDPTFFFPLEEKKPEENTFRIITVGSLIWRKGHEQALMAIRGLVDRNIPVRFEIIGDGEDYQSILFSIQDMDLQEHVHLRGPLTPAEIRSKLQQSDVFLLSSFAEGISNAALEAMACRLPVVSTECGGMSEAITNGVEGFVVPIMDSYATADALKTLWEKPQLRLKMGAAARARILKDFVLDRQVDQFQEMCREVIGKRKGERNEYKSEYRLASF